MAQPVPPERQGVFFRALFGTHEGWVCVAHRPIEGTGTGLEEHWFRWPSQANEMIDNIYAAAPMKHVYYSPMLFDSRKRTKENVSVCPCAWADLDACSPDKLHVEPSFTTETSPGSYQGVWMFAGTLPPDVAESVSRRITYYHIPHGADSSGWPLTKLLRVPGTPNHKPEYATNGIPPTVGIVGGTLERYQLADFNEYPEVKRTADLSLPLPSPEDINRLDADDILQRYRFRLDPKIFPLFGTEPEPTKEGWSGALWRLMMYCFEAGLTREEVFVIAKAAACNKYARDNKPDDFLWADVCRAYVKNEENISTIITKAELDHLLSEDEKAAVANRDSFVERYVKWATDLGDAAPQYHYASAFIALSGLLAGRIRLPTSFGTIVPNLWFMILADTTLTRKSTAMDHVMDLLAEIDEDTVLATDGTIEGLMTALSTRPGQPSIFLKDEFSGLLESMTKKDYMAGMAETLTKLYDGKMQKRLLRKETITIVNPCLIVYAGGIKRRVQSLLSYEHVSSGFIPRFLFVTAESNVATRQPIGPPTERDTSGRDAILDEMRSMAEFYSKTEAIVVEGTDIKIERPKVTEASLTPEAWARYNKFEAEMLNAGISTERQEIMTPLYARLAISTLKAAVLIAAAFCDDELIVTEMDILHAIKYCEDWRDYANDVVNGIGRSAMEHQLDQVLGLIATSPGITRSRVMQAYHLTSRSADIIFSTLEQRGQISLTKRGKGTTCYPTASA